MKAQQKKFVFFFWLSLVLGSFVTYFTLVQGKHSVQAAVEGWYQQLYSADSTSSSLDHPQIYYAPELLSLIEASQRQQQSDGQLGVLSADPLCSCQDPGAIKLQQVRVLSETDEDAQVAVQFDLSGEPQSITLELMKTREGWRVGDVSQAGLPSLKAFLLQAKANQPG